MRAALTEESETHASCPRALWVRAGSRVRPVSSSPHLVGRSAHRPHPERRLEGNRRPSSLLGRPPVRPAPEAGLRRHARKAYTRSPRPTPSGGTRSGCSTPAQREGTFWHGDGLGEVPRARVRTARAEIGNGNAEWAIGILGNPDRSIADGGPRGQSSRLGKAPGPVGTRHHGGKGRHTEALPDKTASNVKTRNRPRVAMGRAHDGAPGGRPPEEAGRGCARSR